MSEETEETEEKSDGESVRELLKRAQYAAVQKFVFGGLDYCETVSLRRLLEAVQKDIEEYMQYEKYTDRDREVAAWASKVYSSLADRL